MNIKEFDLYLSEKKLLPYKNIIKKFIKTEIKIVPTKKNEKSIPIGKSKIGGKPDLPNDFEWPVRTNPGKIISDKDLKNKLPAHFKAFSDLIKKEASRAETIPFNFLAQFNLEELKPFDVENILPSKGILYFFIYAEDGELADDHNYEGRDNEFKVWFFDGPVEKLSRRNFPKELIDECRYNACSLKFTNEVSMHNNVHLVLGKKQSELLGEGRSPLDVNTKLLGYADAVQDNDMETTCERITNESHYEQKTFRENPEKMQDELEKNSANWILLFQLDSESEAGMYWGGSGKIYFWIKKQDLLNKNFDNTWFNIQFT